MPLAREQIEKSIVQYNEIRYRLSRLCQLHRPTRVPVHAGD
jgi:hypothetical protein